MKKILLIEDNQNIRENTAEILELANYKVFTAENGKIGVEVALEEKPDLIICDIMMPVLDGYGVLHLLHKNPAIQNTPFIFLSAKAERADIRRGMELGADDYLTKPFMETELLTAIESRLKKVEAMKQEFTPDLPGLDKLMRISTGNDSLESFTADRNVNTYKKKQIIYSEGNRPARLFYIKKGKVITYKCNEDGKELVVGLYNEGEFLGHIALLEGTVYKEMAKAIEDTELAIIPKEDFEDLMNNNQNIARKFITMLAKNITEQEERLLKLAYNSLRKKVADALITLHKKYNTTIDIGRENLASIAGTATESMIRTLGDFKNEKLIDIKDGNIIILNEKKLESLLN
ncbi:cAMP-binding domain of CRP or a regulatory subunit of cAMP-dependent protein kinases [Filimonas lacunae]|uniref:cAMP-binding domain of CRP or a regulatory subunit of cAMP-dependent protein kinases n=1 Tax=Filimonas lacunae TaxID=477680 RepID=A0A173ME87_9BACT|nr:response regulator [Filimonas lacunae]BAV05799.1 transcriptional regulator, Crp/Fnr family [Filimonas lacunae]SIT28582.1 cAMP-binding domain of CRP or a regulatory subunit of cAMP-dependent protein kinases [Filimonas lacunae]